MIKERVLDIGIGKGGGYIKRENPNRYFPHRQLRAISQFTRQRLGKPEKETEEILRIGFDQDESTIGKAKRTYRIPVVRGNVDSVLGYNLPFRADSLDRIDVIFPHNNLFQNLAGDPNDVWAVVASAMRFPIDDVEQYKDPNIWSEFYRVLKTGGHVTVIFEVLDDTFQKNKIMTVGKGLFPRLAITQQSLPQNSLALLDEGNYVTLESTIEFPQDKMFALASISGFEVVLNCATSEDIHSLGTEFSKTMEKHAAYNLPPPKSVYKLIATKVVI